VTATPPGVTSVLPAEPPKKSGRLKSVLRIAVALALLGGVFAIVKWRDRFTTTSSSGETTLIGRIHEKGDAVEFEVVVGPRAGERIAISAADLARPDVKLQEGLYTTMGRLARSPLALTEAILLYIVAAMISFQRWHVLLRAVKVDGRFWRVQKLGFLGLFFSNFIPGLTGGDVVKAIMVARDHPEQRPAAVLSVIVDRAIGLLGLALVASGALLFQHGRYAWMAKKLNLILLAIVLMAMVVLSRRLRKMLRLDKLLSALPFASILKKLDEAALLYRAARWQLVYAVAVSLVVHVMILTAIGVLGRALGIQIAFLDYYALAPLALIAQSLPLTPGGVGVGEMLFIYFFQPAGVQAAAAFALSFSYRVIQLFVSLIGGVLLLVKHEKVERV